MKKLNPKKKKILISAIALVLVAAIGVGIWFGARGSAEPVNVYPFNYLGMTEYWGDSQESYGPVSTDKIQTVYLSDTQTVTEILVVDGDEVKQGDVLMTFDTTLTELELERKRLEVEKLKLDLKDAQTQLQKIRSMKPMDPDAMNMFFQESEEPDLGNLISGSYVISQNKEYDGSSVEKALICWAKDGQPINDPILRAVYLQAMTYQAANANKQNSSASDIPEEDGQSDSGDATQSSGEETAQPSGGDTTQPSGGDTAPSGGEEATQPSGGDTAPSGGEEATQPSGGDTAPSGGEEATQPSDGDTTQPGGEEPTQPDGGDDIPDDEETQPTDGDDLEEPDLLTSATVTVYTKCNGSTVKSTKEEVGADGFSLSDACTYQDKTYWLQSAKRVSDGKTLISLNIPAFPQEDAALQEQWQALWGQGVTLEYIRSVEIKCGQAIADNTVQLEAGKDTALCFSAFMEDAPKGGTWSWEITPSEGESAWQATPNGNFLILSGQPEGTEDVVKYTVSATYSFVDNRGVGRLVEEQFPFYIKVVEKSELGQSKDNFYMILKVTEDDRERGVRLVWQGLHVFCYADGSYGMTLFDAGSLEDHTLVKLDEDETVLPDIDFGSGYTAAEIAKMRAEQEKTVKEKDLALRMAEAEFKIMQAEVNDGKVCAEFDGEVVSVITEEEARQETRPLLKVSAGGGFYVEASVNELEKDNLKPGQEVTINDWNTGMTYTGTVESIGDFPVTASSWSSADNANVTYYPFTAFVDSSADLQAGSYVSVSYSTAETENGVYLESAFIRTEQGRSYIFVEGEDGKLEKRYVTVGKSLWGSYTQVLSGLTEDDYLAFPYGKTVKEGAPTVQSDNLSSLYTY